MHVLIEQKRKQVTTRPEEDLAFFQPIYSEVKIFILVR